MNKKTWRTDREYKLHVNDIRISHEFMLAPPRWSKLLRKENEFFKSGKLSKIILNQKQELIDGYCSYLILRRNGRTKLPVWFVE